MWQNWVFFLVLQIRVNVPCPFLPALVCLLTLHWLGPPLEDLLVSSHFLFPFSPCFVLLLVVALVRNYPFPAFNLRKYEPFGVAVPWYLPSVQRGPSPVHLYVPCRLSAFSLTLQGTMLEMLFHICVSLGPQELIGPVPLSSSPGQLRGPHSPHHSLPLRCGVLPQVHSTHILTFIFCSGIREWNVDGICNDQEDQHSTC